MPAVRLVALDEQTFDRLDAPTHFSNNVVIGNDRHCVVLIGMALVHCQPVRLGAVA
jgi:hypothetical protein